MFVMNPPPKSTSTTSLHELHSWPVVEGTNMQRRGEL